MYQTFEVCSRTHCTPRQLERWSNEKLLYSSTRKGKGRKRYWNDDTIDRVSLIQISLQDNPNLLYAAMELVLSGYILPSCNKLRKVLLLYIDTQLGILFFNKRAIPSQPSSHTRSALSSMVDTYMRYQSNENIDPISSQSQSLFKHALYHLSGSRDVSSVSPFQHSGIPSLYEQRHLIQQTSDSYLAQCANDVWSDLQQNRKHIEKVCYDIGLSPQEIIGILLLGHACKQEHTIVQALYPSILICKLQEYEKPTSFEDVIISFIDHQKELLQSIPEIQSILSQHFHT
jgi:hypothetical protein